uniref:Uncharacterized protein n=1 Tax=Monodon monoceros TaxID=40151 RepID=A0A8C6BT18_MONMO
MILNTLRKIATLCDSFTTKSLNEHIFPPLMHMVIFFNFFKAPFLVDLKKPELKIPHTVSFYIKGEPRVILGTWHTVSSCRWGEDAKGKGCSCYEAALHDGNPIIVYLHGGAEHKSVAFAWIVATNAAKVLEEKGFPVDAIILEAPFTNIWVARINYPLLKLYEIAHSAYRNKERVKMVIFPPGLQHTFLCKSTTLLKTVR